MEDTGLMEEDTGLMEENTGLTEDTGLREEDTAPAASCVTAHSLHSMGNPISFQKQASSSSARRDESIQASVDSQNEGAQQSASVQSCVSLKSDWSKETLDFFKRNTTPHTDLNWPQRSQQEASLQSCVSLKSNWSMESPDFFKRNTAPLESAPYTDLNRSQRAVQCSFSDGISVPKRHSPIMVALRARIEQFVESELQHLDRFLSEDSEDIPEQSRDDEDEELRRSREAVLHLCTHFLRDMKQDQLLQRLLSRTNTAKCVSRLKSKLKRRFQSVFEGVAKAGHQTDLNQIYTELWITEGHTEGVNMEHEICHIQTVSRKHQGKSVRCQDLFERLLCGESDRTMLTEGVAGIGKTLCVQKVILDWTELRAHHNVRFMLPFSFRELNLLKDRSFCLVSFIQHFFPELEAGVCSFDDVRVVLIFDGLDESRLNLDFEDSQSLTDAEEVVPLDVLLVNLIHGKLLPSARLWITTRPAAAGQIPAKCVSMVTEVRGFTDPQKEQYFRKRLDSEQQATSIVSHMKKHRSLHIMCHIPIFCWILSTVLLHVLESGSLAQLPQTLTQMYIHFLLVQTKVKGLKYDGLSETDSPWSTETRKMVESLGKLAFEQLQKGNLIFYECDLTECGLDAAAVRSGVFTQVFREEAGLYYDKVYCFIHLSVQEFLAALHVHLTFFNTGVNLLSEATTPTTRLRPVNNKGAEKSFYVTAVNKALQSSTGHLDLFLRFLLGLSLQSNHSLLQGLMKHIQPSPLSSREAAAHIKDKINEGLPSDKVLNLFHCLIELGDSRLIEEVQMFLNSEHLSTGKLSSVQWSALVFILLSDTCDVFELRKFYYSEYAFFRLLPVIRVSQNSNLSGCVLSLPCWKALATVLRSESCLITKLDLSYTELQDKGLSVLTDGRSSLLQKLQDLRLRGCGLTEDSCRSLCDLLCNPHSSLTHLDLSDNRLLDEGLQLLSGGLQSSHCTLSTLRLDNCGLMSVSCEELSAVLQSHSSVLHGLDLSTNPLQDLGVEHLCNGLMSPHCSLETLRILGCLITEKGFTLLKHALTSCQLKELDMRYNHPGTDVLFDPYEQSLCSLTALRTEHAGAHRLKPGLEKYFCELTMDPRTAHGCLMWFENCITEDDAEGTQHQDGPDNFEFWHQIVCSESLSGRCYWEVKWSGLVSIAVTYRGIQRRGSSCSGMFGGNSQSWALDCSSEYYFAWHNNMIVKEIPRRSGEDGSGPGAESRVGVYLDWEGGILSFFTVLPDGLRLIHTFQSSFTEPLLPGFRLRSEYTLDPCNAVTLCSLQK